MNKNTALIGLIVLAVIGTIAIVVMPILVPTAQLETTTSRLLIFLGPIVSVLVAAIQINKQVDQTTALTNAKVDDVEQKIDGHVTRLTAVVIDAAAAHPDVAEKAAAVGITTEDTPNGR